MFLKAKHFDYTAEVFISGNREAVDAVQNLVGVSGILLKTTGSQILFFQCERVLTSIMEVNEKFIHSF